MGIGVNAARATLLTLHRSFSTLVRAGRLLDEGNRKAARASAQLFIDEMTAVIEEVNNAFPKA